ncbi:MAG: putative lipid II flippase FtsW [Pseudomonadota bacterium]
MGWGEWAGLLFGGLDPVLLSLCFMLVAVGLLMVYSSSFVYARDTLHDGLYFFKRQAAFAVGGVALMLVLARVPYRLWDKLAWPLVVLSYGSLLAVLLPGVGDSAGGAQRWLVLPGLRFEPSEFAKLAVVVFFAHSLAAKGEMLADFKKGLLPHLLMAGAFVAVIMRQPDMGTSVTITMVAGLMLFVAGARLKHLAGLAACGVPLVAMAIMGADYRMRRVCAFLSPWEDPLGNGFQIIHSFLAFGSGGLLGRGAGGGVQKLWYLPQSHTDFIFSILAEELGLVGVVCVVLLFLAFIVRGIMLSARIQEGFGSYLALGLTLIVGLQAVTNIGVVMGLLPTKGLTLPFISYGGTSLILNMAAVGILLNVSGQWRRSP